MATGVSAALLLLLTLLNFGERVVGRDALGINSFGESSDDVQIGGVPPEWKPDIGGSTSFSRYVGKFQVLLVDLLAAARKVGNLLEVIHPRGGHRNRRYARSTEVAAANSALSEALDYASFPRQLQSTEFVDRPTPHLCRACYIVAHNLINRVREQDYGDRNDIAKIMVQLCNQLNVTLPEVCRGFTEINMDAFLFVLKEAPKIETRKVCASFFPECDDGGRELGWSLQESLGERPPIEPQPFITNLKVTSKPKPVRILHVTDFHFDPLYKSGSKAECGLPVCCRGNPGDALNTTVGAGRWGDYRQCDIPWDTVEEFCKHADETQKFDFMYFTGDIVDHGVWGTSRESNTKMIRDVYQHFKKTVGRKKKVFPIVGNHEPHPLNLFVPGNASVKDEISTKWLYELLAEEWSHWLPADTRETILLGGFYTVRVNSKFRVVALNTMFCYNMNMWMMYNPVDPAGQLSWLVRVLKQAEVAGEKVHILSHIPPGSRDCLKAWGEHYWRIVRRFSDTIAAQFNGHTHLDEMRVFYTYDKRGTTWAFNAAWNAASLTTYSDINPNYKVYVVDGSGEDATWHVRDSEVWGFNLTEANSRPSERPRWFKMHSFSEIYGIPSMHITHIDTLVRRFASERETRYLYWKFASRMADSTLEAGCDNICLQQQLCRTVTTETGNTTYCDYFFSEILDSDETPALLATKTKIPSLE